MSPCLPPITLGITQKSNVDVTVEIQTRACTKVIVAIQPRSLAIEAFWMDGNKYDDATSGAYVLICKDEREDATNTSDKSTL